MKTKTVITVVAVVAISAILASVLNGLEYMLLVAAAAAIHEAGHIALAAALHVPFASGDGGFFGLSLKYDFSASSYLKETVVSSGGALFNVAACAVTLLVAKNPGTYVVFFVFSNISLALFNLLPISPLDGSGILRSLAGMILSPRAAQRVTSVTSLVFSLAFFIFCIYVQLRVGANLSLMFISVFLVYNAAFEFKKINQEPS